MIYFEYGRPSSLMETASLMRNNPGAILFAGGTDVLVQIKQRTIRPPLLIDLKGIPELADITPVGEKGLHIGSLATLSSIVENELIRTRHPVIAQAAATMACLQVRNRGTVGGNLVNASPSADTAPTLMVLDAELEIFTGDETRKVPIQKFFTGPGETILEKGEILSGISVPDVPRKALYIKHTLREAMDIAAVGVCLSRREDEDRDPRLVLGAVAPTPIRVPEAEILLSEGKLKEACEAAASAAKPIDDVRSSADYRRTVIYPLIERAYQEVFGT